VTSSVTVQTVQTAM